MSTNDPEMLFALAPIPTVPVRGTDARFPVNRIFCVGRNYEAHAKEMGMTEARIAPMYFIKDPSCIVESGATVPYPPGTRDYHHEIELVAAIDKPAFRIDAGVALDIVFGYACGLDMTRRDLQALARDKGWPWDTGKNFEQSAIISELIPAADTGHISSGSIALSVNGEVKQSGDISDLIWSVPELIADLSKYYHLQPGDLIYTGTPAGIGPVLPGDHLVGTIDGVGEISLSVGDAE
jgi:fumarylpyruvate hydrolase